MNKERLNNYFNRVLTRNSTGLVYVVGCCQRATALVCRWLLMTTTLLVLVTKVPRQSNWNTMKEASMIKVKDDKGKRVYCF